MDTRNLSDDRNDQPDRDDLPVLVPETAAEQRLELAALVASAVPFLSGPLSQVLGGIGANRRSARIIEAVNTLALNLREFRADATEQYVRTEDFAEILEHTLRRIAEERNPAKRRMYANILTKIIMEPGAASYDEQVVFLRTLEGLQDDHLSVLHALAQEPPADPGMMGSPLQTIVRRVPGLTRERVPEIVGDLNRAGLTRLESLNTTMTGRGAESLQTAITRSGYRFLAFIQNHGRSSATK